MKSQKTINFIVITIAIYLFLGFCKVFYGQEIGNPKEVSGERTVIEQALKNYEAQKKNEQDGLTAQLNFRLGQATETWITSTEKNRNNQLGTFIEQEWDKQARTYMITPIRFDYYLRGYEYSVSDSDVIKTDSVTAPYKAIVVIKEVLYAEKYHHPNTSDTKLHYYTVTSFYTLDFAHKDGEFILVNSNSKMESIVNDISHQARRDWALK